MSNCTCQRCGAAFVSVSNRPRMWCSACLDTLPVKPCASCGDEFAPRSPAGSGLTYCTPCAKKYRADYSAGKRPSQLDPTCATCGNVRPAGTSKFCSAECRYPPAESGHGFSCAADNCSNLCRSSHPSARFCSKRCRNRTKLQSRSPRSSVHYGVCACGTAFCGRYGEKWCKSHRGMNRPLFGPRLADWPEFGPTKAPVGVVGDCEQCLGQFFGTIARRFCSDQCRHDYHRSIAFEDGAHTRITYVCCSVCTATVVRREGQAGRYCSRRCAKKVDKRARRALRHGATHEPYTLREIAERDNWTCHLCGKKVPDREYAARDKDATIDHLVPVSAGGDDIRSNVALAHNRCNWERGAAGVAQLRLVG